jgi:predicted Rossmann-fold nucleotide-binding protein
VQAGKLLQRPIILVGEEYWCGLGQWLVNSLQANGIIGADDLEYLEILADADAAASLLLTYYDGTTCGTS